MSDAAGGFCIGWDVGGWNCDKYGLSRDALVLLDGSNALVAHRFATQITALEAPGPDVPEREGWIWVPRDAFEPHETKSPMDVRLS